MMPIYVTREGDRILADTDRQLIHKLREASFMTTDTDREFMREVARLVKTQTGATVSTTTVRDFVSGLVAAGLITVEDEA